MKIYSRHGKKKNRSRPRGRSSRQSSLAARLALYCPYYNPSDRQSRLLVHRPTYANKIATCQSQQHAIRLLSDPNGESPPPLSQAQLVPVIKGVWHLSRCSGCQGSFGKDAAAGQGCSLPICKSTRRLIHKIASHSCPNARCPSCSVHGLVEQSHGKTLPPPSQHSVKSVTATNSSGSSSSRDGFEEGRCKVCKLWGYIMRVYLSVHMRAASSLAQRAHLQPAHASPAPGKDHKNTQ